MSNALDRHAGAVSPMPDRARPGATIDDGKVLATS
jgi:hypothetical protein